jgi:SRSO17 transposase
MALIGGRFARCEAAAHAGDLVAGLVSDLERKNCWTIAERVGHRTPGRLQHLLAGAVWDAGEVRDDLCGYAIDRLCEPGEQAVLVIDETGDLKKGKHSVGVQRQYTGTAGRVENAQVAVFLTLVAARGYTFVDRALYLPESWADDLIRRREAGVPDDVEFATKPALATEMIARTVAAGAPARWVAGDEVYGACPRLRASCRHLGLGYVLAVGCNHRATYPGAEEADRVDDLALSISTRQWQRLSAGSGSKGERLYSWARIELAPEVDPDTGEPSGGRHWLMIRRNDDTGEIAYYRCWHPHWVPLTQLVHVAGQRWHVEENFQTGKGLAGLDEHQVRTWASWHRWTTLAMAGHAVLTVIAHLARQADGDPTPRKLIPYTVAEVRRLFLAFWEHLPKPSAAAIWAWSHWRRQPLSHFHLSPTP